MRKALPRAQLSLIGQRMKLIKTAPGAQVCIAGHRALALRGIQDPLPGRQGPGGERQRLRGRRRAPAAGGATVVEHRVQRQLGAHCGRD